MPDHLTPPPTNEMLIGRFPWFKKVLEYIEDLPKKDAAHDIHHYHRVWHNAIMIIRDMAASKALPSDFDMEAILAACYLHDIDQTPKGAPDRAIASVLASNKAADLLVSIDFPEEKIPTVVSAIIKHSFSGQGHSPHDTLTVNDAIVRDADNLDALGFVGFARMMYTAGMLRTPFFHHPTDPFGVTSRELDDKTYAFDHVAIKLSKVADSMCTAPGGDMARDRYVSLCNAQSNFIIQT